MKDYYQILEVPSDASQDVIKEQYRFLVQAWHPDKFPNPAQKIKAVEKIKEINAAYEILRNPAKRAEYDGGTRSSQFEQEQEYRRREEVKATQRRAEDERRKREEATRRAKEERSRKERADKEKDVPARDNVKVFINGKECTLSMDRLVKATVQYFLEGEYMGGAYFATRGHVDAQVNHLVRPRGYEIHVTQLAGQEQRYRGGREWEVKSVRVFVERNDKLEERIVKETDLFGAHVQYYFGEMPILGEIWIRNLQDVKVVVRKCKKNDFNIVVKKFAS